MEERQALTALSALSAETRLRMLRYLVTKGQDGAPAGEIGAAVGSSSSRSSFHLAALTRAGLLQSEKVSRRVIYRVDFQMVGGLLNYLLEDCCGGHPDIVKCCQPGTCC